MDSPRPCVAPSFHSPRLTQAGRIGPPCPEPPQGTFSAPSPSLLMGSSLGLPTRVSPEMEASIR